jgi:hypothetical protein
LDYAKAGELAKELEEYRAVLEERLAQWETGREELEAAATAD